LNYYPRPDLIKRLNYANIACQFVSSKTSKELNFTISVINYNTCVTSSKREYKPQNIS